jgi:hypothetical protein
MSSSHRKRERGLQPTPTSEGSGPLHAVTANYKYHLAYGLGVFTRKLMNVFLNMLYATWHTHFVPIATNAGINSKGPGEWCGQTPSLSLSIQE